MIPLILHGVKINLVNVMQPMIKPWRGSICFRFKNLTQHALLSLFVCCLVVELIWWRSTLCGRKSESTTETIRMPSTLKAVATDIIS